MDDEVRTLLKPDFIYEYVVCYLQILYKYLLVGRITTSMYNHVYSCIQDFNCVKMDDVDFDKGKEILIDKCKLKIIKDASYLEFEEI